MVTLLGPRSLETYQMIKISQSSGTFLKFLQMLSNYIWLKFTFGHNVIVLDNVALHKVSEVQDIYPHKDVNR